MPSRSHDHLTAGAQASTMGEIASIASRYFRKPSPRMLSAAEFAKVEQDARFEGRQVVMVLAPR